MANAWDILGTVKKHRRVYLVGNTRIHLDDVEGLGEFLEMEVVLPSDQETSEGAKIAEQLMDRLGIQGTDLIGGAYLDLILSQTKAA